MQQQVQDLMAQLVVMQERIAQLEGRLALNSKNSSKPPSSDGLSKPAPKSSRKPGQKPSGGQPGHEGRTLRQSAHVDETVVHRSDTHCIACHLELREHTIAEIRQVFELPELRMRTVAHHQMRSSCTCGGVHLGVWPAGVKAPAQYGASVKAMAVHLNQYHLVPLARTTALMQNLYGAGLSQASIQSFAQQAAFTLRPTVGAIAQAVQDSAPFEARGLLEGIKGVLVHDGLVSYKGLGCTHSLCNAHHIRKLVHIHEQENEKIWDPWAQQMIYLLLQVLLLKRLRKCRQDV